MSLSHRSHRGARVRSHRLLITATLVVIVALAACSGGSGGSGSGGSSSTGPSTTVDPLYGKARGTKVAAIAAGIHKIKHVIIIMQENRSFDSYFGTYPGAEGIPHDSAGFTVCIPDPKSSSCARPYHDPNDVNAGSKHSAAASVADVDNGKMDGFVTTARGGQNSACSKDDLQNPVCVPGGQVDVMGYHDSRELPNYWKYANDFVLQDHMFAPVASWSLPAHLYLVSAWSAKCVTTAPRTCSNNITGPILSAKKIRTAVNSVLLGGKAPRINFSWTDITHLLYKAKVSWGYYIEGGAEPDCEDDAATCAPTYQTSKTPGIWNPLPLFADVHEDKQLGNIQDLSAFRTAVARGRLPAVSWIVPNQNDSEHPPASIRRGQAWVTGLINSVMRSPEWDSTAIFVSWDDWGGFYDHVPPPTVDGNGYGLRVPGLVISPYAKRGYIDHQVLSHDAYLKFIEDDFLAASRLDPATDGRWDPRLSVRENAPQLGDLAKDFDFTQPPRSPELLP